MEALGPWGLPLFVLAVGGVLAFWLARGIASEAAPEPETPVGDDTLKARKEEVLKELRELEERSGEMDQEEYERARAELVAEGARILRRLDGPVKQSEGGGSSGLTLAIVAVFFLAIVVLLAKNAAQPRLDGEGVTGGGPAGAAPPPSARTVEPVEVSPEMAEMLAAIEEAKAAVEANPHDIDALNLIVHHELLNQNLPEAMRWNTMAREVAPENPDVVAHSSALAILVNMADLAIERLDALLVDHPDHAESKWWRAVALANKGQYEDAKSQAQELVGTGGEFGELAPLLIRDLDAAIASEGGGSAAGAPSAATSGEVMVSGSISVAGGASLPPGAVLFVAAVSSPNGGGPPLAARRITSFSLPLEFSLGPADSPRPVAWPESFWVRARIDLDGDPAVESEGELESELFGPISAGQAVELLLQ